MHALCTRALAGSPSRLLRLPLQSCTASQAWTSLPFSFTASNGTSKGGTASGKPQLKAATREGSGEEQTGSSYSQKRWGVGMERQRGQISDTVSPSPKLPVMVPEYERRVDRSECVSFPHAGDTLRTSAYLCVGGPAWSPPQRVRTCWLLWLPLDKGGSGGLPRLSSTPPNGRGQQRNSVPEAGSYLGSGSGTGVLCSPGLAGVPAPLCPPPPAPRPPSRQ